ncbi:MAG: ChaN family lipoprotein [Gemmatimonadetes bacterium]|nr:ChaN family lipoprotein [Gemmatimonadota bacterium]
MRLTLSGVAGALLVATLPAHAGAQHPSPTQAATEVPVEGIAFRVYDAKGHSRSFADILKAMDDADAVLVGETHDDQVGHGVEDQLLYRAAERFGAVGDQAVTKRPVVLSMEMFERDVQYILNEYLQGLITEDQFKSSARPWPRYDTDYRPLVEFARAHGIPVVAANAPRRYVNRVSRLGPASLDELSATAKQYLPPLPYPPASKAYAAQFNALMGEMMQAQAKPDSAVGSAAEGASQEAEQPRADPAMHSMGNALAAQALWDAAMGNAVANALDQRVNALVIHYAGSFHVEKGTGIPERVEEYRPGTRILTVVLEPTADINTWQGDEDRGLGDFVVLTKRPEEEGSPGR